MPIQFPEAAQFLFQPMRFKGIYGGRGKGGSWSLVRAALILGSQRTLRILFCRETMESLQQSSHQLLEDQIKALNLEFRTEKLPNGTKRSFGYTVLKSTITGGNGTEINFAGLKDADALKSAESYDLVVIDEAERISDASWKKLIPTIRKDPANLYADPQPSEIWLTWNPELISAATHQRFVIDPPANAKIVKMSYRENPFFPPILEIERQDMLRRDPDGYQNVWEGECLSDIKGAIFSAELKKATKEGRFCSVPYDRTRPVDTAWDLGFGDTNSIWFLQAHSGWYNFIDYYEGSGLTMADYIVELQSRSYIYGTDWVPWDSVDANLHAKLAGGDRGMSIEQLMRKAGRNVRIAPKLLVSDRINAGRTIFGQCRFDAVKCRDGIEGLRLYQWGPPSKDGVAKRAPRHDNASHPSDAFQTAAVAIKSPPAVAAPPSQSTMDEPEYSWLS